jgi:phospholipid/cholesterol/gamma-HCH transport system permease protein
VPDIAQAFSVWESHPHITRISFDCSQLSNWDSTLLTYIFQLYTRAQSKGLEIDLSSLPRGVSHLLQLAMSSAQAPSTAHTQKSPPFTARFGARAQGLLQGALEGVDFLGQCLLSLVRFVSLQSVFRTRDLLAQLNFCGAQALPIVSLISLLVGLILAFVGAVQLKYFGAQIYVADLVGIAMTREMGAMMTGIIMAGRTGAAFAAQLGTMQVNEEIDALHTLGISPFDFLVLPRILALVLMMPLLCLYADAVGIMGGAIVGMGMLDISLPLYWNQTMAAITLPYVWLGVVKSCVFGFIVAFVGCLRGVQAGRSAQAVGQAATSAVVTIIVGIIVVDGLFAVICDVIGI